MITIEPPSTIPIPALSASGLTRFLNRARQAVDLPGEVEVLLTGDAELKRLNRSFRNKNKATDVLSFPAPPPFKGQPGPHHAGDLAISLETAARQAASYGHTLRDEVRILLLHGLLHLSGLDHETDNGQMAAREATLRRELRLPNTLIERTQTPSIKAPARPKTKKPATKRAIKKPATKKAPKKITKPVIKKTRRTK
ncbi:rRNA maturation RNase YbeY [Granulicella sp. L60]|jgi:probable rRNA maturation factor|uniref:rRNA maturation RNase YbeY n=1 Tax=Granulicella sp. L60 TaxID=1641866 RepID=UPI00131D341F|nr:rRNA maturation RNase YbeY [Granulicella sp. L60]